MAPALVYMTGNPSPSFRHNPNLDVNPNHYNPRSNSKPNHIQISKGDLAGINDGPVAGPNVEATTTCHSSSSLDLKPAAFANSRDSKNLLTFKISTFSKNERERLKRQFIRELEQVRSVILRVESLGFRSNNLVGKKCPDLKKLDEGMMKRCGQILGKLMKSKGAIWFNAPVDAANLGLDDYHKIIKVPMDLGTVKSKFSKGVYDNSLDFASDVRLTFNNALTYNPVGHEVHRLASQLLRQFENSFSSAYSRYEKQRNEIEVKLARMQQVYAAPLVEEPVQENQWPSNKNRMREMSLEEKSNLGVALQNLTDDKLNVVFQVIRDRNVNNLIQDEDEVEIDLESMDNDTIWEIYRLIKAWENSRIEERQDNSETSIKCAVASETLAEKGNEEEEETLAKGEEEEEDVDIVGDMPVANCPSVEREAEKRENENKSCNSSGADTSSSDSDSESSSDSDSDDDDDAKA